MRAIVPIIKSGPVAIIIVIVEEERYRLVIAVWKCKENGFRNSENSGCKELTLVRAFS